MGARLAPNLLSAGKIARLGRWGLRPMKQRPSLVSRVFSTVIRACGLQTSRRRRVRWGQNNNVFTFERQLFGGGGVPDGDEVSLGLGPR